LNSDRGLPIHRIPGGGRAAVPAFKPELDEWLQSARAAELLCSDPQDDSQAADRLLQTLPAENLASATLSEPSTPGPPRVAKRFLLTGTFLLAGLAPGADVGRLSVILPRPGRRRICRPG
jgi:hypothetical protein